MNYKPSDFDYRRCPYCEGWRDSHHFGCPIGGPNGKGVPFKIGDKVRLINQPDRIFTISENYLSGSPLVECISDTDHNGFSPFATHLEHVPVRNIQQK